MPTCAQIMWTLFRTYSLSFELLSYLLSYLITLTQSARQEHMLFESSMEGRLQVTRDSPQELPPALLINLGIDHEIGILIWPHWSPLWSLRLLPHIACHHPIQHPIHRPTPTQIGLIDPPIQRLQLLARWPGNRRHLIRAQRPTTTRLNHGQPLRPLLPPLLCPLPTGHGRRRRQTWLLTLDTRNGDSLPCLGGS